MNPAPTDSFDTAFAAFAADALPGQATPPADAPASAASAATPAEPAAAPAAPAGEAVAETTPALTETPSGANAAPPAEQETPESVDDQGQESEDEDDSDSPEHAKDDDQAILRQFAALVRQAGKTPEGQQAPAQDQKPAAEPDIYTADERALLESYQKDFPDIARAEALARRAEYSVIVKHVFNEIAKELRPLAEIVDALATQTHLEELRARVTDYDDIRDRVVAWVGKQPSYLQDAYTRVIREGTPDEVTDLIQRYRSDVGARAPAKPAGQTQPAKDPELPSAARQAAAALAPVGSKRSSAPSAPDTFADAFAQFAKLADNM